MLSIYEKKTDAIFVKGKDVKRALISGITGQDGFFLTQLLRSKNYEVIGLSQLEALPKTHKNSIAHSPQYFQVDMTDSTAVSNLIKTTKPDEVYHLASQSSPGASWERPAHTLNVNGLGTLNLLEAVRHFSPQTRVFHASSADMYGKSDTDRQNEKTPFNPLNPYAASKLYAHQMSKIYRESYGLFIANGILFNHESERRPLHFVTQKIAYGAACAALGILNSPDKNERDLPIVSHGKLALGHLGVSRDWGYAPDFVRAMWLMLQQPTPDDFVIGTGELNTLLYLCEQAYHTVGCDFREHIAQDAALKRPTETKALLADATQAKVCLGWTPSVSFDAMIQMMVAAQVKRLSDLLHLQAREGVCV